MFYHIKPDKTPEIELVNLHSRLFPKESRLKIVRNHNLRAFNIWWVVEKNREESVGFIDFYYKVENGELRLDSICLEFEYKISQYVQFNTILEEILKYIKREIGGFTIHDTYLQRSFHVSTRKNRLKTASILFDSRSEAFTRETELLNTTANESDVEKVLEKIRLFPDEFSIYSYSGYIAQLKRANLNTQEKVETILTAAFERLAKVEDPELKIFLLFKVILYYKSFSASYVDLVPQKFLIKEILPLLMKLSLDKEIGQLLIADTTLYLFNSPNPDISRDAINELLDVISDHKTHFLLYPELKTIHTFVTTGSYKTAFEEYLKRTKNESLKKLRNQYEKVVTDANLITEFKQQALLVRYYGRLSWVDRLKYYPDYLQLKDFNEKLKVEFLFLTGIVGFMISLVPYIHYFSLNSLPNTVLSNGIFSFGFIIFFWSLLSAAMVILPIILAQSFIAWLKKSSQQKLMKVISVIGASLLSVILIPLLLVFVTASNAGIIKNETLWGVSNDNLVIGYEQIPFKEMKSLSINVQLCDGKNSCKFFASITAETKEGKQKTLNAYGLVKPSETKNTCAIINKVKASAKANNVRVSIITEDEAILTSTCGK